jgi:ribonuclease J
MTDRSLEFLTLGGTGEVGMNLALYGYGGKWIMVDCGVTFGDEFTPGIDVIVPDIAFVETIRKDLLGIVLTHAHEDHYGAIPHLWRRIGCPVFGTPFACGLLRRKLEEAELDRIVPLNEVPCGGGVDLGPFRIDFIPVAHSIPETQALAIRTPVGIVLHATDWKLDDGPLIGPRTDPAPFQALGREGVIAMMCDSTNAMVPGRAGSEAAVRESLIEVIGRCKRRVAVACFASNVARLETVAMAARANGREIGLVGRSLWNVTTVARDCGYLQDCPEFLTEYDAGFLPPDRTVLAVTGSQGEARAALARIAADDHPEIVLEAGDTVIFSSREIPGNEKAIGRVQNMLARAGVKIITADDEFVHVSGHPRREELVEMYGWVKPPLVIPIHGERRMQDANAALARECGATQTVIVENGDRVRLHPGPAEIVGQEQVGRFGVEGSRLLPLGGEVLKARRRLSYAGMAVATVVVDERGRLRGEPRLSVSGLLDGTDEDAGLHEDALDAIRDGFERLSPKARRDDDAVEESVRRELRRALRRATGRRTPVEIHVVRV